MFHSVFVCRNLAQVITFELGDFYLFGLLKFIVALLVFIQQPAVILALDLVLLVQIIILPLQVLVLILKESSCYNNNIKNYKKGTKARKNLSVWIRGRKVKYEDVSVKRKKKTRG